MRVWTYWEGPQPPIIDCCLKSISRHYPDHMHLTAELASHFGAGQLLQRCSGMIPQHRADLLRLGLLAAYPGSVWLDADFLCFKQIPFDEIGPGKDLVSIGYGLPDDFPNGMLLSRRGVVAAAAYAWAYKNIRPGKSPYKRYGSALLQRLYTDTKHGKNMHIEPRSPWLANITERNKLTVLGPGDAPDAYMFHLSAGLYRHMKTTTMYRLRDDRTILGKMIAKSGV